jgi:hypothetical protein
MLMTGRRPSYDHDVYVLYMSIEHQLSIHTFRSLFFKSLFKIIQFFTPRNIIKSTQHYMKCMYQIYEAFRLYIDEQLY